MKKLVLKIKDWIFLNYAIDIPVLDIWLFLIIIFGSIILIFSIIFNGQRNRQENLPATKQPGTGTTNIIVPPNPVKR
jgi:hypothetical protein